MLGTIRNSFDYLAAAGVYLFARTFRQTMNASLTPIEPQTQISPLVYRILGANPGPFTLQGTNTYLVGSGKSRVLIDTGEADVEEYITQLRAALGDNEISCIICTHWHDDHVGGVSNVISKVIGRSVPVYKFKRKEVDESYAYEYVEDGHIINATGATLRLIATPGHTTEHMSVYLEEENTLFSGDCILGEGTSIFEDLYTYMNSLHLLLELKPSRIYPGHGPVIENPTKKITEYINHRNQRENEILEALKKTGSATTMDITNAVYKNVSLAVKLAAVSNVKHHLSKLIKENKVEKQGIGTYRIVPA